MLRLIQGSKKKEIPRGSTKLWRENLKNCFNAGAVSFFIITKKQKNDLHIYDI